MGRFRWRSGARPDLRHIPVHVPFHIGNRRTLQDAPKHIGHRIAYFLTGEVQDQPLSSFRSPASIHMQAPVRMLTVQIAIRGNHLRLKPQAELHIQIADPLHEIRLRTRFTRSSRPSGALFLSTTQSPREVVSSFRLPNHPSSSTNSSIPRSLPALAICSILPHGEVQDQPLLLPFAGVHHMQAPVRMLTVQIAIREIIPRPNHKPNCISRLRTRFTRSSRPSGALFLSTTQSPRKSYHHFACRTIRHPARTARYRDPFRRWRSARFYPS